MGIDEPARISFARYQSKFSILLLFWLLSPSTTLDPKGEAPRNECVETLLTSKDSQTQDFARLGGSTSNSGANSETTTEILWTPKYDKLEELREKVESLKELQTIAVKGSTSTKDRNLDWSTTPALSSPPRSQPTEINIEEEGEPRTDLEFSSGSTSNVNSREDQHDETVRHHSSPSLSPPIYTLLLLHIVFLMQYLLVCCKSAISQSILSNPLPPPFRVSTTTSSPQIVPPHISLSKRISRLRWRLRLLRSRCGTSMLRQSLLAIVVLTLTANGIFTLVAGNGQLGWNGIYEIGSVTIQLEGSTGIERSLKGWVRPCRDIVLLELLSTLLILLDSFSPILLSLYVLPATLSAPRNFLRRGSPPLLVPITYLLPHYLNFSLSFIALLQDVVLIFSRNLLVPHNNNNTYHLLSFTTLVFVYSIFHLEGLLLLSRETLEKDFEKILYLIEKFSKDRVRFKEANQTTTTTTRREGILSTERERLEEGDRWKSLLEELESESCCICFEEEWQEEEGGGEGGAGGDKGFRSRCFLTDCGHQVHAVCLYSWFKRQSFCPACHMKVQPLTEFPPI